MNRKQHTLTIVLALVAGLVGGALSSQFLIGQPVYAEKKPAHEKVVRAERFELVNKDGKIVTELWHKEGTTKLEMRSGQGHSNIVISATPDGETVLTVGDSDITGTFSLMMLKELSQCWISSGGKESSSIDLSASKDFSSLFLRSGGYANELYAYRDNGPGLELKDNKKTPRASLRLFNDEPVLFLKDKNRKNRVNLHLLDDGPALRLNDKNEKAGVSLQLFDDYGVLTLSDNNQEASVFLGLCGTGPALQITDAAGVIRAALGSTELTHPHTGITETRPASSLVLFNEQGNVMWAAP